MKRIVLVSASPRKGGNSEVVVGCIDESLKRRLGEDVQVELFKLSERTVGFCKACDVCQGRDGQMCVQRDDMTRLLPCLEAADAVVLAAPIYNQMLSAQAVAFIDRFYPFFREGDSMWSNSKRRSKKAAVVAVSWGSSPAYAKLAEDAARGFCQIGASQSRGLAFGGVNARAEIGDRPSYLSQLEELAGWLVS